MLDPYVTLTIYFRPHGTSGCLKVHVEAVPSYIEEYARQVWDGLSAGGFEMKSARP